MTLLTTELWHCTAAWQESEKDSVTAMDQTQDRQVIKARIALAVSSSGRWDASGGTCYDSNNDRALAETACEAGDGGLLQQYWIEVEIPVPTVQVLTAKCEPAKP